MAQKSEQRPETTPMESLQGSMNLILTVIGRSLAQPNQLRDPQQRFKLQTLFPSVNFRFHEGLDRIEEEIQSAQWILKRELALHRVKEGVRASRELKMEMEAKNVKKEDSEDVDMQDIKEERAPVAVMAPQHQIKREEAPPTQTAPTVPAMIAPPITSAAPSSECAEQAPTTAVSGATEQENLGLPTSATDEPDFSDIFGDADMGDDEGTNPGDNNFRDLGERSADVSSLLPGLESYANMAGTDSAMSDVSMPPPTTTAKTTASGQEYSTAPATSAESASKHENPTAQMQNTEAKETPATTSTTIAQPQQQSGPNDNTDTQPDFGDIDFGSFDTGGDDAGGGGLQDVDNTFNDLLNMDDYGFGGSGDTGTGGQDLNDWMNTL
ncbi:uncharacterized protein PV09_08242 [Verruconis gallopava]|uniref:Uncharacterized protein n=1 Tax=Verruconis gallopava TaxID=253628 RepID=A0A0D1YH95_9PEZI|nr:uncharacterized protein PV09_08242 [Verruconis gallopava]KIW00202.1 hypothetical protein PV09_08242 [Verruconis gallopava]